MLHYAQGLAARPPALYKFIVGGARRLLFLFRPSRMPSYAGSAVLTEGIQRLNQAELRSGFGLNELSGASARGLAIVWLGRIVKNPSLQQQLDTTDAET